jgi:hypothetical protein
MSAGAVICRYAGREAGSGTHLHGFAGHLLPLHAGPDMERIADGMRSRTCAANDAVPGRRRRTAAGLPLRRI